MNLDDIMLDIESLSIKYDAPIIAIGAVHFNRTTGKLGAEFYEEVSIASALRSGNADADTLRWWIDQSKTAKRVFANPDTDKFSLATVLMNFSTWCRSTAVGGVPRVWAKGPSSDVTWVDRAMAVGGHGLSVPWHFRNIRCVRTIIELAEEVAGFEPGNVPNVGTEHNALDDARYQANVVCAAYAALHRSKVPRASKAAVPVVGAIEDDEL